MSLITGAESAQSAYLWDFQKKSEINPWPPPLPSCKSKKIKTKNYPPPSSFSSSNALSLTKRRRVISDCRCVSMTFFCFSPPPLDMRTCARAHTQSLAYAVGGTKQKGRDVAELRRCCRVNTTCRPRTATLIVCVVFLSCRRRREETGRKSGGVLDRQKAAVQILY